MYNMLTGRNGRLPPNLLPHAHPQIRSSLDNPALSQTFFTAPPPKNFDLQEIEKIVIEQAVAHAGGNNQQAINLPGITREGLRNKLLRIGK